jgi:hypothetical protein
MKIRCIYNTGEALRPYEYEPIQQKELLGRFGATGLTEFGLTLGEEFLVVGMILGKGTLSYLINDGRIIGCYPYALFEVIDNELPKSWFFKALKNTDENYPYQEAIWGYYELCFDTNHYEQLVDFDEGAHRIYFRRKIELEKELEG